jgi:serine/threonine protein kinase/Flp pilus assembly protein TadD
MSWDTVSQPQSNPRGQVTTKDKPNGMLNGQAAEAGGQFQPAHSEASSSRSSFASVGGFVRNDPRVIAALEAYLEALRAGHPWSREEFLARHTEIAEELGECISGLEFIQTVAPQLADARLSSARLADDIPPSARLGEYRILREVGRGGMGVVYEAEQVSLGRRVALKVLPFAAAIDPKQRQRFQIEAQAAAQLHHPHIVPIFGVGCDQGIHYYAMQFVEGRSLAAILHELRSSRESLAVTPDMLSGFAVEQTAKIPSDCGGPEPARSALPGASTPCTCQAAADRDGATGPDTVALPRSGNDGSKESLAPTAIGPMHQNRAFCENVARLGAEAADALEHAHGLGIVHRDIKPANLLIDPHGALWITDFGLARFASDLSLTHTGDMVGTLRYMSPEQCQARGGVVDQRTDIYALGVTLYELLTLQPAFNGRDHQELLRQIAQDEPVSPRRKNSAVPRDLETIVLKAIAKDPASRYTTAQELAADLRRFMEDQPILARRPGIVERTLRWAHRRKDLVVTAAAILMLASIVGTAAYVAQIRRTNEVLRIKDAQALKKRDAFIIDRYPLLDHAGMDAINRASNLFHGQPSSATPDAASQAFDEALSIFQQVIELPPDDLKARTVIARAYTRLGYARWMMSIAKASPQGLDPGLLADAKANFRKSMSLLEQVQAESPDDPKIRRYMAEALGLGGMGCCLYSAMLPEESEPFYRRSIEIRRELLRGTRATDDPAHTDVAGEFNDLSSQVSTVQILTGRLDSKGHAAEADTLRRQLDDDIAALAARLSKPEFTARRRMLAGQLINVNSDSSDQAVRRDAMLNYGRALKLDPENAKANNNLAWSLVCVPGDPWFDPARGLALARKAVALQPNEWANLNTLGVAAYRAREWNTAKEVLQRSITFTGGAAHDLFFLAMTSWQQGKVPEARILFDRAVAWTEQNKPGDPELIQFRAEAAALLGLPCSKAKPEQQQNREKKVSTPNTARNTRPPARISSAPLL